MDPDSETYTKNKPNKDNQIESFDMVHDVSSVFQPFRVRRSPILASREDWKFASREFRFVLYSGIIFWTLHLLSLAL